MNRTYDVKIELLEDGRIVDNDSYILKASSVAVAAGKAESFFTRLNRDLIKQVHKPSVEVISVERSNRTLVV